MIRLKKKSFLFHRHITSFFILKIVNRFSIIIHVPLKLFYFFLLILEFLWWFYVNLFSQPEIPAIHASPFFPCFCWIFRLIYSLWHFRGSFLLFCKTSVVFDLEPLSHTINLMDELFSEFFSCRPWILSKFTIVNAVEIWCKTRQMTNDPRLTQWILVFHFNFKFTCIEINI